MCVNFRKLLLKIGVALRTLLRNKCKTKVFMRFMYLILEVHDEDRAVHDEDPVVHDVDPEVHDENPEGHDEDLLEVHDEDREAREVLSLEMHPVAELDEEGRLVQVKVLQGLLRTVRLSSHQEEVELQLRHHLVASEAATLKPRTWRSTI